MSGPSGKMWAILTAIYAIVGVFIGLAAATIVLIRRHLGSLAIGSTRAP
jgi:hypothetical protein